jgi:pimeloyl-ACP methyl ester carboxylesterase
MSAEAPPQAADDARGIVSDGARFTYLEQGSGTPLVLLHGIGSAARSWRHQLRGLGRAYRVIAWDAPGYGGSSPLPQQRPDAGDYADALEKLLCALNVERFHLVGHSLGCVIAARYARLRPERLLSLTLASVATGHARLPAEERARLREARLGDLAALGPRGMAEKRGPRLLGPHAAEDAIRAVIDTMAMLHPHGYAQAVHMLSAADTLDDLRALPPSLRAQIIYGDADVITPPAQNQSIARELPQAQAHVLSGAGHALYLEQPGAFNALLMAFLEGRQAHTPRSS